LISLIPVREYVAAVSVGIVGGEMMLDLAFEEDSKADVDMNIVMTGAGEFIEVQGTAEHQTFNNNELQGLLGLARSGISQLIDMQRGLLKGIL
jgi:ribonuclease PH